MALLLVAAAAGLVLLGITGSLAPSLLITLLPATSTAHTFASLFWGLIIGGILFAILLFLRQYTLLATIVVALHLYVDWYLGLLAMAQVIALLLLLIFFMARSPDYPWTEPRLLWLWLLYLGLGLFPAIQGSRILKDFFFYYPNTIVGALLIFWLGHLVARDIASLRTLFQFLTSFAALLALHTIILGLTGKFLLSSGSVDAYVAQQGNYFSNDIGVNRYGGFFIDPNWNGTFFAMMIFVSFGLLLQSSSWPGKLFYLGTTLIMLPALLFTYSAGALLATGAGILCFIILAGDARYRIQIPFCLLMVTSFAVFIFPDQVGRILQRSSGGNLPLRMGAWETALAVIAANPLTGVGIGLTNYLLRAEPFRVAAQYIPLDHPHESYLEMGAMAGLPFLFVFLLLLTFAVRQALRYWMAADKSTRTLLGGGIAAIVALSVNSLTINAWTLPPIAELGWLILGALSSPLLARYIAPIKSQKDANSLIKTQVQSTKERTVLTQPLSFSAATLKTQTSRQAQRKDEM
ncbi:hypothetical protein KDK_47610 [Dictyobacter kobayashii]|uniref:O-antigen ligase-related domain-containing protein n=2 Tax=Dictyobacter kobayashii TaxID=2014872 RepID=A0A402AP40_9CHLR|nr:hypothetical protein KDK_47610 [Dictyobacter kobayashii]